MRDVKSSVYFDQMKGRGTRTIDPTDLQAVTGDAKRKTHFVLVDAVGVTENEKTDTKPLERKPSVSFEKLLRGVALGAARDEDSLQSLADRLARLDRALDAKEREEIEAAAQELIEEAVAPITDPDVRETIKTVHQRSYIAIDEISADEVIEIDQVSRKDDWAEQTVQSFEGYIDAHRDEITALQIFYEQPYGQRHLTLEQVNELAAAIEKPPLELTPEELWSAYARLEKDKVKGAGEQRLLTDIIALVRHAMSEDEELHPFRKDVEARFYEWLSRQDRQQRFTPEQLEWLELIKDHLVANLTVEMDDFEYAPFDERGGIYRALDLFDCHELEAILDELNEAVTA